MVFGFVFIQESFDSCLGCLVYLAFVFTNFLILKDFFCIRFSMYNALTVLSVIRNRKSLFHFLITGNTSSIYKRLSSGFFKDSGSHLLSHAVSSIVPSAAQVLTVVFGMRTGVSPERIATGNFRVALVSAHLMKRNFESLLSKISFSSDV